MNQNWQLPDYTADLLPEQACRIEDARLHVLTLFRSYGYAPVCPPLMEYGTSLLTHTDAGLSRKTLRLTDPVNGRQLGIRADITPQLARIDAHLLGRGGGVNRLCYSAPVLHAYPDGLLTTREPFQTGAELYGCADVAADIEVIELMLKTMQTAYQDGVILALGHLGVFRALAQAACLNAEQSGELLTLMQSKDRAAVAALSESWQLDGVWAQALAALPELYGGRELLETARARLPHTAAVLRALDELAAVCAAFPEQAVHIDLADVRVDPYHSGLLYAAYVPEHHDAVARGGRYDGLGGHFGQARPATGFSFDLKLFGSRLNTAPPPAVSVRQQDYAAAREAVERLRGEGVAVCIDYGTADNTAARLVCEDGEWVVRQAA